MSFEAIQAAGIVGAIQAVRCGPGREMGIGGPTGVTAVTPRPGITDAFDPRARAARRRRGPRYRGDVVWQATERAAANNRDADGARGTEGRR
ncbi:hypothetical protein [Embleya scabrispora]|uniref:hypothetical protein n=1 Tax=Embleya scabrispora TaxID=159449 RepID=UPI000399EB05|nr:hypothetical protein [Embleya scabrispora]MYS84739.1 hypothetical protein [Streptomyces sp. SID5474]